MSYIAFLGYIFDCLLIGIGSSWEDFPKKHKFHGERSHPGAIFEKKDLQNQECHFLKMACCPILIPDSESM